MSGRFRRNGFRAIGLLAFIALTRSGMHLHNSGIRTLGMTLVILGIVCGVATLVTLFRR
ncbi:hypothetical protein [Aquisalinus flavus]|nr:hypothetical protein [Aquisalinus flavus]MBD0427474.1 hypothetical protein [Aquisalinus flavus]